MVKETKLYDLLNVSTEASEQEIRRAYKLQALKYHPDKQSIKTDVEKEHMTEMFKAVSEAHDILTDTNRRYLYDNYGEEVAKNPEDQTSVFSTNNHQYDHDNNYPTAAATNFDYSTTGMNIPNEINEHLSNSNKMFNSFFNEMKQNSFKGNYGHPFGLDARLPYPAQGQPSQTQHHSHQHHHLHHHHQQQPEQQNLYDNNTNHNHEPYYQTQESNSSGNGNGKVNGDGSRMRKGRDIMDNIHCSLLDYYNGKQIKLSLSKRIKCPRCKGLGGMKVYTCNDCGGMGVVINETRNGLMYQRTQSTCMRCHGTGSFIPQKYTCDECGGNKLIDTKVIYDFKGPRGVSNGYRILIPNAADEGINLIPGDVILTLCDDNFSNNSKFKRFGDNLLTTISLPLVKALCGGYINFEHINGEKVKIHLRSGEIKSANQLKVLKGYGMPTHRRESMTEMSKPVSKNKKNNQSPGKKKKNKQDPVDGKYKDGKTLVINNDKDMPNIDYNSESSCTDENSDLQFGDLIIKFELELPDVSAFTNKQVELIGQILGSNIGYINNSNKLGGLSVSSSSDDISSTDDMASLKMNSQFESSASSLSKSFKSGDNSTGSDASLNAGMATGKYKKASSDDFNESMPEASNDATDMVNNNAENGTEDVIIDDIKTNLTNVINNEGNSGIQQNINTAEVNNDNDSDAPKISEPRSLKMDSNSMVSDTSSESNENDAEPIVYLSDLTNVDKTNITWGDFPVLTSIETSGNGDSSVSAKAAAETAETMDHSYSAGRPRNKRMKTRRSN